MNLDQIVDRVEASPGIKKSVAARFNYSGKSRIVDNLSVEADTGTIVGFEMRSAGKFSYKIKRYSVDKIEGDFILIDPPDRIGPQIGRP